MQEVVFRAPVACPKCMQEWLMEFTAMAIADALESGEAIHLFASCHEAVWNASCVEREQLGEYLDATTLTRTPASAGEAACSRL